MNVIGYFIKLKKCWDELACIRLLPSYTCSASKELSDICDNDKLIQFLMGLNSSYDHVRYQILLMDSFPPINKAYLMVLQMEKQREVNTLVSNVNDNSIAMMAKNQSGSSRDWLQRDIPKERNWEEDEKFCDYCRNTGHTKDNCFKIIGYLDWFK